MLARSAVLLALTLLLTACGDPKDDTGTASPDDDDDGYTLADGDCDDGDPAVHPGATEVCDEQDVDEDCSGAADDEDEGVDPTTLLDWYVDADADGYGDADTSMQACDAPDAYVAGADDGVAFDCDDLDDTVNPGATEVCDEEDVDEDCDGLVNDDDDSLDTATLLDWYADTDSDGYGDQEAPTQACDQPSGHVAGAEDGGAFDCDDTRDDVNPAAIEVCDDDDTDEDCDGLVDDDDDSFDAGSLTDWYADADGDGFGDPDSSTQACDQPSGYLADGSDCDDTDAANHPGADEYCDEVDNDCDGDTDEAGAVDESTWYLDADDDGYGDASSTTTACDLPSGYTDTDTDCDDSDAATHPGATEACDSVDRDCDGTVDTLLQVPGTHTDIQDAIDAASTGNLVCVAAGTYLEVVAFGSQDITVESYDGPETTIIDGMDLGLVVRFTEGNTTATTLRGFTLTGGAAERGPGLYLSGSDATVDQVIVSDNVSDNSDYAMGSGVYVYDGELVLSDSVVTANHGEPTHTTNGVYAYGAVALVDATATLTGVEISDNTQTVSSSVNMAYSFGGGLYASNSTLVLDDVDITGNSVEIGASGNTVITSGGGLSLYDSDATITDLTVSDNSVTSEAGNDDTFLYGGGIYAEGSSMDIDGLVLTGNVADASASDGSYAYGGGFFATNTTIEASHALVADNELSCDYECYGGGLCMFTYSDATWTNAIVAGNGVTSPTYAWGGGVFSQCYNGQTTLTNVDVVGNFIDADTTGLGAGVRTSDWGDVTLTNVNIVDNTMSGSGSLNGHALAHYTYGLGGGVLTMSHDNVWGNSGGSTEYFNTTDPVGTDGNISGDPDYTDTSASDAASWDLTLGSASVCTDAGDSTILDTDGSTSDIGAYGGPYGAW